ncbi:histone-fold-containing protein [Talaromyces proteolyticus]|uniref:Histone-fold-containing protein n=1 Tax=Talaromyces proteolyticus TaxID=1131652 RepID=A0AAD4KUW2_9EURO|nr:histone-fold-containing protein [Talaromyces proteolyticus]KAH8700434.1 histone-fold-containing protein [Talaromyces proteolyticus]
MSSASPPKEPEVEPETQSGDDPDQMDRDNQDPSGQGQGEFEVKEQDRWLPIANGSFHHSFLLRLLCVPASPSAARAVARFARAPACSCCAQVALPSQSHCACSSPHFPVVGPSACSVARIMKTALPENAKIAKEAKECMQECVSEFISFITSEASEKCQQEKRKTVNGEDILFAMTSLGFENYAEALKIYLSKYRETQSARGENQNRPTSSGYGAGGPVGGSSSAPAARGASATAGGFPGASDNPNSILPGNLEEQDSQNYGYGSIGHNGAGAEFH